MRCAVLGLLAFAAACGRTHPNDDTAMRELAGAQCRYLARCHPRALAVFPGGTIESCSTEVPCWAAADEKEVRDASACRAWFEQAPCSEELLPGAGTGTGVLL